MYYLKHKYCFHQPILLKVLIDLWDYLSVGDTFIYSSRCL